MGLRGLIKKVKTPSSPSDPPPDPSSNPYAQEQQPPGPPPDYNDDQYATNQRIQQPPQGSYGGLPSGPRSGVVPGGVTPGFPTRSASNGPPPPQYPSPGAGPPSYGGSEYSPGGTPVLSSATSSPRLGSGYPREKYGAQDGVGKSRYAAPTESQYDNPSPLPSQRPGGYGSLDVQGGGGFAGYNGSPQPIVSPDFPRPEASSSFSGEQRPMTDDTEEEQVQAIKSNILHTSRGANQLARNNIARVRAGREQLNAMHAQVREQGETLKRTELQMINAKNQVERSGVHLDELKDANKTMFNLWANSRTNRERHNQKKIDIDTHNQMLQAEARQQQDEDDQQWEVNSETQLRATKPGGLLGASDKRAMKPEFLFEETFEDDTGEQAAENAEWHQNLSELSHEVSGLRLESERMNATVNSQLPLLDRISGYADVTTDGVTKQKTRLETTYLRK